ncbi:MAG: hypothetical protein ACOYM3_24865 [Terrimicrobiaceae bacterium]
MRDRAAPSSPRFFSSRWFAITAFRAADISVRVIDVRSLVRVGTREKIPKTGKGSKMESKSREPRGGMRARSRHGAELTPLAGQRQKPESGVREFKNKKPAWCVNLRQNRLVFGVKVREFKNFEYFSTLIINDLGAPDCLLLKEYSEP